MANTKIEMSKKDMNFFSEFTGSSNQVNAYIPYILLILVALVVVGGVVYGFLALQTAPVRGQIELLNADIDSEENQGKLKDYTNIYISFSGYNLQYYDVSSLLSKVENESKVDSTVMDAVYQNLPADVFITGFSYEAGTVKLEGSCSSYYSPLDMLANFRKVSLFTKTVISSIEQVDFSSTTLSPEEIASMNNYNFSIVCSLKSTYPVVTSKLLDNTTSTPLTAVDSQTKALGEQYEVKGINTYTADDGTVYTVSRIMINNVLVTDAEFTTIKQNDLISGITNAAVDIKIFYVANGGAQS